MPNREQIQINDKGFPCVMGKCDREELHVSFDESAATTLLETLHDTRNSTLRFTIDGKRIKQEAYLAFVSPSAGLKRDTIWRKTAQPTVENA